MQEGSLPIEITSVAQALDLFEQGIDLLEGTGDYIFKDVDLADQALSAVEERCMKRFIEVFGKEPLKLHKI